MPATVLAEAGRVAVDYDRPPLYSCGTAGVYTPSRRDQIADVLQEASAETQSKGFEKGKQQITRTSCQGGTDCMSNQIIAMPPNMAGHCAEVLNGAYDIKDLTFEKPPVILDLGANVGSFVHWANTKWPGCEIHTYEPNSGNFDLLVANCKGIGKVTHHPCAVSDHTGMGFLWDGKHNCGESSLVDVRASATTGMEVNVVSAESLPPADILKLDTEGSEWPIISTYPHLYNVTAVMVEWHYAEDHDRIKNFLEAQGLACVDDRRTQYYDRGLMKFQRGVEKAPGVQANSINLLIACPCYGGMTYATHTSSVIELNNELLRSGVKFELRYLPNESLIPRARNRFGTMMVQGDYTHLLFLDVDIGFKARDIISLIALDKDIVALPYSAKDYDWRKIIQAVQKGITDPEILKHCAGRPIINADKRTDFEVTEPVQFPQLGTGVLLSKRKVFEKMAEDPKRKYKLMQCEKGDLKGEFAFEFFKIGICPKTNFFLSEDYFFCEDAQALGFETWLWPNAVTTHTGSCMYIMDIPTQAALGITLVPEPKPEEVPVETPLS